MDQEKRIKVLIWDDNFSANRVSVDLLGLLLEYFDEHYGCTNDNYEVKRESLGSYIFYYRNNFTVDLDFINRLNCKDEESFNFIKANFEFNRDNFLKTFKNLSNEDKIKYYESTGSLDRLTLEEYDIIISDIYWEQEHKNWIIDGIYNLLFASLLSKKPPVIQMVSQYANEIRTCVDYRTNAFKNHTIYLKTLLSGIIERFNMPSLNAGKDEDSHSNNKEYLTYFKSALISFQERELINLPDEDKNELYNLLCNHVYNEYESGWFDKFDGFLNKTLSNEFKIKYLFPDLFAHYQKGKDSFVKYYNTKDGGNWYEIWSTFIIKISNLSRVFSKIATLSEQLTHGKKQNANIAGTEKDTTLDDFFNKLKGSFSNSPERMNLLNKLIALKKEIIDAFSKPGDQVETIWAIKLETSQQSFKNAIRLNILPDGHLATALQSLISEYKHEIIAPESKNKDQAKYLYCIPTELVDGFVKCCEAITNKDSAAKPSIKVSFNYEKHKCDYLIDFIIENSDLCFDAPLRYICNNNVTGGYGSSFNMKEIHILKQYAVEMKFYLQTTTGNIQCYDYLEDKEIEVSTRTSSECKTKFKITFTNLPVK